MKWLGLTPFALYVLIFLAIPSVLAIGTGFIGADGAVSLENFAALANPVVLGSFWSSIWVSALTAVVGALLGALLSFALAGAPAGGALRRAVDSAASVLAQFGGVMLAFAFIATIGIQGLITVLLRDTFGIDIFADGVWLYQLPGLILPYLYFQVPLMVIVFLPAMEGLRREWAEASATLGSGTVTYWTRIAGPILAPSFLGSLLLLFANAFSSYATAAALISQGAQIVPLQIRAALIAETGASRANTAGALALGMLLVMLVVMIGYSILQRRAARWQQ
ncbi:MAG: ABC transporter permease [Microbacteriaceae bacterium]|jgi:putative spermidine/putrescine transport system permease protein|nr:ABC transporter permease [Microbacteriaceae bacterium]